MLSRKGSDNVAPLFKFGLGAGSAMKKIIEAQRKSAGAAGNFTASRIAIFSKENRRLVRDSLRSARVAISENCFLGVVSGIPQIPAFRSMPVRTRFVIALPIKGGWVAKRLRENPRDLRRNRSPQARGQHANYLTVDRG